MVASKNNSPAEWQAEERGSYDWLRIVLMYA